MLFIHSEIAVGLVGTSYNKPEIGGLLSVCVVMFNENLERNVLLTIIISDDTAIGMTCRHIRLYTRIIIANHDRM